MIFSNSIINANGTPSIYEDMLTNRPAPSTIGRLFVATDSPYGIYRDQGTSWQLITGSGGGNQNWNNVLSQGGKFTNNRNVDLDGYNLFFNYSGHFEFNFKYYAGIGYYLDPNGFFYFASGSYTPNCFSFETGGDANNVRLGDFAYLNTGVSLQILPIDKFIYSTDGNNNKGLFLDFDGLQYYFGDYSFFNNGTAFFVNDFSQLIFTNTNGQQVGFLFNGGSGKYDFGDCGYYITGLTLQYHTSGVNGNDEFRTKFYNDRYLGLLVDQYSATLGNTDWFLFGMYNYKSPFFKVSYNLFDENDNGEILANGWLFNSTTSTYTNGFGLHLQYYTGTFIIGNLGGSSNGISLNFALNLTSENSLFTSIGAVNYGFKIIEDQSVLIGDWTGSYSKIYIQLVNNDFIIANMNKINLNGTGLTSTTSGSISSNHLIVYINGTQYKIQLRNP